MSRLWASLRRLIGRAGRTGPPPPPAIAGEADWLRCEDHALMLAHPKARLYDRKHALLACGCARRVWEGLTNSCRSLIDGMESSADAGKPVWPGEYSEDEFFDAFARAPAALRGGLGAMLECMIGLRYGDGEPPDPGWAAGRRAQASLVRDVFGNPFRPRSAIEPGWLAWAEGTVPRLAQVAYDERHLPAGTLGPARLAVLADALEEAGCDDAHLLSHLRGPGLHVRGCFVIDALLGKK
jgi:hypothetical protein